MLALKPLIRIIWGKVKVAVIFYNFTSSLIIFMPNCTSLNYVFKLPSHILFKPSTYSLLALNAKLPSFYYSPLSTTAIFLHKNFTHWLSKNSLLPHTEDFLTSDKMCPQGKIHFTGQIHKNPYKTLWNFNIKKHTFHSPPMFYYVLIKTLQGKLGQNRGRHRAKINLQGKVNSTPDVLLWYVKSAIFHKP